MARILYGMSSVGWGHVIRSKTVIDYLRSKNHKVMIITSHKAYKYFKEIYPNVHSVEGLEIVFKQNSVLNFRTILKNAKKISKKTYSSLLKVRKEVDKFKPQIAITDMEPFISFIANDKKISLISLDNQQFLFHGIYDCPKKDRLSRIKAIMVVKGIIRNPKYSLIMALPGEKIVNKPNLFQIKSVIRNDVTKLKSRSLDYVLVYQSTKSYDKLIEILKRINYKFIVYGFDVDKKVGNLVFKKFDDKEGFLNDLADCKAVVTNGGFTLISEAIYLHKPMLVVPIKKHFEQVKNALYVKENNFGEYYDDLDEKHVVEFIMSLKKYNFDKVKKWDNQVAFSVLDTLIGKEKR